MTHPGRIPWHRRVGVRLGAFAFALLFALDLALFPLWERLYMALTPEWSDPEFLHAYADWLATVPPEERASAEVDQGVLGPGDLIVLGAGTVVWAAAVAGALAAVVWWTVARRVGRLARHAATPLDPERGLAAPFEARGSDEIAALARAMDGLRARVQELLATLAERDRARREWVRDVSHDLRTPLAALGVALERAPAVSDRAQLAELLASARQDVARVQDLAVDLLELARLDAGEELAREPVPPGELLRAAVTALAPLAAERRIALELDFPPHLSELAADGRRLLRALENLLVNSLQHARARVRVVARAHADELEIAVEDDGTGFPEAAPETSPERSTSRPPARAGIGLEVARKVLAAHGGRLELGNAPDGGARVVLRLPWCPSGASGGVT